MEEKIVYKKEPVSYNTNINPSRIHKNKEQFLLNRIRELEDENGRLKNLIGEKESNFGSTKFISNQNNTLPGRIISERVISTRRMDDSDQG